MITPAELNSPTFGFSNYSVFFSLLLLTAYFLLEVFLSMPSPLIKCKLLKAQTASDIFAVPSLLLMLSI